MTILAVLLLAWTCTALGQTRSGSAFGSPATIRWQRSALQQTFGNDGTIVGGPSAFDQRARKAFKYSLYGTLLPLPTLVLTVPGLVVGPSLGYLKSGLKGRAWIGIGVRTIATGGVVTSFAICGWDCGPGDDNYTTAWILFVSSSSLLVGSAIYDIATVKGDVRRHDPQAAAARWSVSPAYFAASRAAGLRLQLTL